MIELPVLVNPGPQKNAQIPKNVPYFSPWSSWSICSSTCGLGTEIRQRSCIYTHAQSGWQTCHGATFQAKKCNIDCEGAVVFEFSLFAHWITVFLYVD